MDEHGGTGSGVRPARRRARPARRAARLVGTTVGLVAGLVTAVPPVPAAAVPAPCDAPVRAALAWGLDGVARHLEHPPWVHLTPTELDGLGAGSGVVTMAAGASHGLALLTDGSVLARGTNFAGELGDGTVEHREAFVPVSGLGPGSGVVAIATGTSHSLALKADGSVWAWGRNASGQLGDTTTTERHAPVQVVDREGQGQLDGVVAIAAGGATSLAVRNDGSVMTWGYDVLGTGDARPDPAQVPGLGPGSGVVAVAAGEFHGLALAADGTARAWGFNGAGQLGDGTTEARASAVVVAGPDGVTPLGGVVAVAGGAVHSLARRDDGSVWAWGGNGAGQLGDGTTDGRLRPGVVAGLGAGAGVIDIAAGHLHGLAVSDEGAVLAWGGNDEGQLGDGTIENRLSPVGVTGLGPGSKVAAVVAGSGRTSLALQARAGTLVCGGNGQAAEIETTFATPLAVRVMHADDTPAAGVDVAFSAPASGASGVFTGAGSPSHTAIVRTDADGVATAPAFVANAVAGTYPVSATAVGPPAVFTLTNTPGGPAHVQAGSGHGQSASIGRFFPQLLSALVTDHAGNPLAGVAVVFTAPAAGAAATFLGGATTATVQSGPGGEAVAPRLFANGVAGTYVVEASVAGVAPPAAFGLTNKPMRSGGILTWGTNEHGQLGNGEVWGGRGAASAARPALGGVVGLGPGTGVVSVSAGGSHNLALKADGSVVAWGYNFWGQLGDSTATFGAEGTPVPVAGLGAGSGVVEVAAGGDHSLALKADGSVVAWGRNDSGQLGDGTTNEWSVPTPVAGLGPGSGVVAVSAGTRHSLALRADGSAWAWGDAGLGLADRTHANPVAGLAGGVVAISAGFHHSLAMLGDGAVWAWGTNTSGELGDGSPAERSFVPVRAAGLGGGPGELPAVAVAAGQRHSVAVLAGGSVVAWGDNATGQLGNPSVGQQGTRTPVAVAGLGSVTSVAASRSSSDAHTLAVTADGSAWAWGSNVAGQLGDGTTEAWSGPVVVAGLGPGSGVVGVAAGGLHSAVVRAGPSTTAVAGTPQQTPVGTAFRVALAARVTDVLDRPVGGVAVTFAVPTSGPGATFPGGASHATVTTDAGGVATATALVANSWPGAYSVTASAPEYGPPAVFSLTNTALAPAAGSAPSTTPTAGPVPAATAPTAAAPPALGYWMAAADGGVFAFGQAGFFGSPGAVSLGERVVGMAATPSGRGYWMAGSGGGVGAFGDAPFLGSPSRLNHPIVAVMATPSGRGYWLAASDGGVFAFGDARFLGSTGGMRLNQPVVAMAVTSTGQGYWLIAADGGVFSFGDARFSGSTGAMRLNEPIVAATPTPTGRGYWLVAADGGVFAFGDARFLGSTGGMRLNRPVAAAAATRSGRGYWLVAADGGVFAFGDAPFLGSAATLRLIRPIVGLVGSSPAAGGSS